MSVHPDEYISFGLLNPYIQRRRSRSLGVIYHPYRWMFRGDSLNFLPCSIVTQPVDNKHFKQILVIRSRKNRAKTALDIPHLITARHKNRNEGIGSSVDH